MEAGSVATFVAEVSSFEKEKAFVFAAAASNDPWVAFVATTGLLRVDTFLRPNPYFLGLETSV